MFIETYYDERAPVPGSISERMIPYPELSGEELDGMAKLLASEETDKKTLLMVQWRDYSRSGDYGNRERKGHRVYLTA